MREIVNAAMIVFLGLATVSDLRKREISVCMLVVLTILSIGSVLIQKENLWETLGGIGIGLLFFLFSKCTREQIGYGDSWLILILGIYVGASKLLSLLLAASFGAGIFSLIFCTVYKWNRKYAIPFVPFLTAAFVGVVFL